MTDRCAVPNVAGSGADHARRLSGTIAMKLGFALGALLAAASPALAVEKVPMPFGATDIDFVFNPGECAVIRLQGYGGGSGTTNYSNNEACVADVFRIDFTFNGSPAEGFYIFPLVKADAPEVIGRKTVVIKDAYWTYHGAFYEPVWTDGMSRVAVVPEPGTWGLLLAGFGVVGGGMRVRRRVTKAA
jgi:hypothetical protein